MKIITLILTLCATITSTISHCQELSKSEQRYIQFSQNTSKKVSTGDKIVECAMQQLGTPYVAGSLEVSPETLTIDLSHTDCMIFVESCVAAALNSQLDGGNYATFCKFIQELRYRNGEVNGYCSRLHYTSEWLLQAEENGYIEEITEQLGGVADSINFSFMSHHPTSYKQLANDPKAVDKIAEIERQLSKNRYFVIPKSAVKSVLPKLNNGDIILFCTSINGLDITHMAIVYKTEGRTTFIHASSKAHKVIVEQGDISNYINKFTSTKGIRIARVMPNTWQY